MEKYTYKESGVEWLGNIPEHWKTKRLFNICEFIRGNSSFEKNDLLSEGKYVALQYGKTYKVEEVNEEFQYYVNEKFYKNSQIVNYGDVIFVSTSETMEDLGHSVFYNRRDIGLIGGEQILLKPNKNTLDGKYLFYASKVFGNGLNKFATGIKVFRFDVYDLKTIYISLPKPKEQKAIAEYLDKATARIDRIIAVKQEQLVKMEEMRKSEVNQCTLFGMNKSCKTQDLNIEYLPKINAEWKFDRFKDVARLRTEKTGIKSEKEDYIELEDLSQGSGEILKLNNTLEVESKVTKFFKGDVVFGKLRPYLEKYAIVDFDGKCTGEILAFEPFKIEGKYLMYVISSKWFINLCNSMSYGAKMPRVNWNTQLSKIYIPLPSNEEQKNIIKHLDKIADKDKALVKTLNSQIETLQAYRKSLIHECVTGKKQVTSAIKNQAYA